MDNTKKMRIYKISGWDKHFENNRTRELKFLSWVPFPNKHDGDGYTELMDHKDGVTLTEQPCPQFYKVKNSKRQGFFGHELTHYGVRLVIATVAVVRG